tara:strand:- start:299 stop:610 length:312 start_codon:yes stop_codon:yes gene_type:complete
MSEEVNPKHYQKSIQTYDAIVSQLSSLEVVGFLRSQILKYTMRFGAKHGSSAEACLMDVRKANWYSAKLELHLQGLDSPKQKAPDYVTKPNITNLFNKDNDGR